MRLLIAIILLVAPFYLKAQQLECKANLSIPEMERNAHAKMFANGFINRSLASNNFDVKYYRGEWQVDPAVCLLYTSPSPRDRTRSRMPSSA